MSQLPPILLDVTRLIAHRWSGRPGTGIDRVCLAYLEHFATRAQAVVQLGGIGRVLSAGHSRALHALLAAPDQRCAQRLASLLPAALASSGKGLATPGAIYLNVGHSGFDLAAHARWIGAARLRAVYLIHDLIPIRHPWATSRRKVARHRGRVLHALRRAAGIIVNSQATAADLLAYAEQQGLAPPPLLTAPLGLTSGSAARAPAARACAPIAPVEIPRRPYFVCLGTIERRKNHLLLLDLWQALAARLGDQTPSLLFIGRWGVGSGEVRARLRGDPVLWAHVAVLEGLGDAAVNALLGGARALLVPSLAEGYGLPVLEALQRQVPVIASRLACFEETAGSIAELLDPSDRAAWEAMILDHLAHGPAWQAQQRRLARFVAPSWENHFGLLEAWLGRLALPPVEREPARWPGAGVPAIALERQGAR